MSLWRYGMHVERYNRFHDPKKAAGQMTDQEAEEIARWLDAT